MKNSLLLLPFFILTITLQQASAQDPCKPEQIHLALSDAFLPKPTTNNIIKVIFHTQEECKSAYISLKSPQGSTNKIKATSVKLFTDTYTDGNYSTYIHVFDLKSLDFSSTYEYSCYGTDDAFLAIPEGPFKFYVPSPNFDGNETKVVMFADMDHSPEGMYTVNKLSNISQSDFGKISAFIHNGDMSYNLINAAGKNGDDYMNTIQKFTATMPYMVTAGNHENTRNFSNFNARFQMPNYKETKNHYYSYNIGNMHFVSFNLDLTLKNPNLTQNMLKWLENDLENASLNRNKQPWIIAYTHRPFYCSYPNDSDCANNSKIFAEFEDLLIKYDVDLVIGGHVHFYERMLPIKKGAMGSFQHDVNDKSFTKIVNPKSPIYVLQGMAGHRGDKADPKEAYKGQNYTIWVSKAYSYLTISSKNSTHLLVENTKSRSGDINDYFSIIRSSALEYAQLPPYQV